jgi:hypothetical protein
VLLTNDPDFVPTEQPDVDMTPPGPAEDFTATPGAGQIDLGWTNPADADLDRIVIRYRTDGQYPTSPVDGLLVVDKSAVPGALDGHTHLGATAGTTYSYSAFSVDAAGNVSGAAHAVGSVGSPPAAPENPVVY